MIGGQVTEHSFVVLGFIHGTKFGPSILAMKGLFCQPTELMLKEPKQNYTKKYSRNIEYQVSFAKIYNNNPNCFASPLESINHL